jgi:DNA-binding transcriptional MerR regulator
VTTSSEEAADDTGGVSSGLDWPIPLAELAARVGMTPRNIRAHQSRGLLPPPVRRGRIACYDQEHEQALLRIKELQSRGYNLAAIDELMRAAGDEATALQRVVLAPILAHDEVVLSWPQIAGMFDQQPDPDRYRSAVECGMVRVTDDGEVVAPSRALLDGARKLLDLGVPFNELFDMQIEVVRDTRDIARRFVELCLECALAPFGEDSLPPPEKWDEARAGFEQLYQRMTSVLAGSFAISVRRATEDLLAERERRQGEAAG